MLGSIPTEQLLKLLAKCALDHAVMFLDTSGHITAWLAGSEKIFGYAASEVQSQHVRMLFAPEDIEKGIPELEMEIAWRRGEAEDDRWMVRKDGLRFWATGVMTPLVDDRGELIAFGKILRNRTDLKGQIETLERRLDTQQKAIERKNVFISTLAHELRNPLSSIVNAVELLNRIGSRSEESIFARSVIRRQTDFIHRMVEDLLDVAQVGLGKVKLETKRIALNDVIRAAVETCRPCIDSRRHNIQLVMISGLMFVRGDPDRLQQVFVNLIHNATKYTQHGGDIWIKAFVEGDEAVVKVEDTGIGISPEMLPRIFDLFTQLDEAPDRGNSGLGLGLSIVKDLIVLHGGTVTVRSDGIGRGSQFTVRLPLIHESGIESPGSPIPSQS